jgi:asparagine synthase (glutamine-hydrolysing)
MPGLVGVVGDMPAEMRDKLLRDMAQALKHEDWYQVHLYVNEEVGLGQVSLGLLNPEPQPVWNEDHTLCVVMEGEVYDYEDEKQRLIERGHRFQVNNDPEFVLHLYEEYGQDFALKLNGAFVAAIWEPRARRLLVVNDRLGLRPLYYAQRNEALIFAAGVRALLTDSALPRRVDPIAIAQYLSFGYVLGNRTLASEAHLMPPASLLVFCNGGLTIRPYWSLEFPQVCRPPSEESYLEGLIHHLRQAVNRQAHDDLPAGVLLSGGLDSRVILAFLSESPDSKPLHTFTFGIPGCDDARFSQEVAALMGTRHRFYELRPVYLLEMGEEGVRLTDGLNSCADMHALATLRAEAEHARVLYIGFLGDALMGGHLTRQLWADYDEDALNHLLFDHTNTLFSQAEQADLFSQGWQRRVGGAVSESFRAILAESQTKLVANQQNHFDLRQRQRRFILNGHELLRSRVVLRTPFCDNDLVEFVLAVPPGLRLDRWLLIRAFARAFPNLAKVPYEGTGLPLADCARSLRIRTSNQLRWRLHAAGMKWVPLPRRRPYADYNGWMRTVLRRWVEETLLSKRSLKREYFDPEYIRNLVAEHMAGANHARKLGVLLTLELWHRLFLD